jgi:chemotaxis protein methyltransferase CheR
VISPNKDTEGVQFLQWCLPKLHFQWQGFRKVRKIVLKRVIRRVKDLGLSTLSEYRARLENNGTEWIILDSFFRIPISRFYRDKMVFRYLEQFLFDPFFRMAISRKDEVMRLWSIGCASGEEPYTLAIIFRRILKPLFENLKVKILATDVDAQMIHRAINGCYSAGSIKDLPEQVKSKAFLHKGNEFCIKEEFKEMVDFSLQDIRDKMPENDYYLILCRNIVLTYFDEELQKKILEKIIQRLVPGGILVIGSLEKLPEGIVGLEPLAKELGIYRKPEEVSKSKAEK